ncbi:unnamed protein product [Sphagnum troendelagicum]|uniref:Uncharacterized protein n=1 Tax=Sphagnum troendelagicum TaxID=128251 RepID=A0ABP0UJA8_9BRYO
MPEAQSPIPHTPHQETTPRGKRGQQHLEVPPSFTSLGISIPQNWEPLRARVWPVLAREKNSRKEIVVHSKSLARPSLSTSIRITGPAEAEWSHNSAWADLTQRHEVELEEKVFRYKLSLKDRPKLEWSWQEVPNREGVECTILAHIDTGTSALSIQNKRHLHWKALELILGMNNDTEFAAPAHSLLMKAELESSTHQESKNRATSIQASPQAAHKKRFTKLDISTVATTRSDGIPSGTKQQGKTTTKKSRHATPPEARDRSAT